MEWINNLLLNSITPLVENFEILGYFFFFLLSMLESTPVIGIVIPGMSIVMLSGLLVQQGHLNLTNLIFFVAIGAIVGDYIGYYLGTKGTNYFTDEERLLKLSYLDKSKDFFKKHGSKSVFFGRFIGPLRSLVPFVAGLSSMNRGLFLFWNIISGFSWATASVLIGYYIGESLTLFEGLMNKFLILALIIITFFIIKYLWKKYSRGGAGEGLASS